MQQPGSQTRRVKATKGFYATVQGQFGIVNPGDVVDVDRHTAAMVISANKAADTTDAPTRQSTYLPERKRNPRPSTETLLAALVKATESNTKAIEAMVVAQSAQTKEGKSANKT